MFTSIPTFSDPLSKEHVQFIEQMSTSCRRSILQMISKAASGHTGGSFSMIDFLTLLYAFRISQTGEKIVISNGHTAPSLYAILAEMGYADKEDVVNNFRQFGTVYEGHVNRHMPGVWFGTGPLGCGFSGAVGFALASKIKGENGKIFATVGDGELNEGQAYEAAMFANKHHLDNLIVFVDYNRVQLMGSLEEIMPMDIAAIFKSLGWRILQMDGHNFKDMWRALKEAENTKGQPTLLLGVTIMGKGVSFIEEAGSQWKSSWHGKPVTEEETQKALEELQVSPSYEQDHAEFKKMIKWYPKKPEFRKNLEEMPEINTGNARIYDGVLDVAPRTAYGQTLLDLALLNPNLFGMSADVGVSVRTDILQHGKPDQFFEFGIQEQNMLTAAGAMSLNGLNVFVSAYGPFMTSRAKDQIRLNDINHTNVKMVATHSGLSVGEDGPTHQAIDDIGSFLGFFNTNIIEPADANQMDKIVRYIASHYGNFYVRCGRHDTPILKKRDGTIYYDENYIYEYGKADLIREGNEVTILASGPMVYYACAVADKLIDKVEVIAVSAIRDLDRETILRSLQKTRKLITVEDHNPYNGLASQVSFLLNKENVRVQYIPHGVTKYQLSGKYYHLYKDSELDSEAIERSVLKLMNSGNKTPVSETGQVAGMCAS